MELIIPDNFTRVMRKKPMEMQKAIVAAVNQLREDPSNHGLRFKKMQGTKNVWELRVDGNGNRITLTRDGDEWTLLNNCNHDILKLL
ncbi:hypothetical protein [Ferrimicrobium sp.]|uniref:hypothetical protein n=1 Tax=Ferrimicrobium sp. TaxID=2926050 RepID=UPI002637AC7E|nr:hypothetical protein [Ferrimicrobium sp.]